MIKNVILCMFLVAISTSVQAQDAYVGVSVDYGSPLDGDTSIASGLLGGVRFGEGAVTYGAEVDLDLTNDTPYDASRLRGTVYNDMGKVGLFAALGATYYDLDAGGAENGFNIGLGADYELQDNIVLRAEAIRDHMPDYSNDVTTFRVGVAFGF